MTDVVIIGGGIAGMSACAQLAQYVKVVLLEAEPELCYHSSGRSAATYIEDYGNQVTKALNKASLTFLKAESRGDTAGQLAMGGRFRCPGTYCCPAHKILQVLR